MKFDDLDKKMRVFETAMDQTIVPGMFIVARLDGRGFTKLTKEDLDLEKPFDKRFKDAMVQTVEHLMSCGFRVVYGYVQSDEISLLLHPDDNAFQRKTRKILSVLAGEASGKFSVAMGHACAFDCRISPLASLPLVIDYFRWRHEDAHRNSLSAYCYWKLRESGKSVKEATNFIEGKTAAEKNELLYSFGINYNDLPAWQKRGIGFYCREHEKESVNKLTGKPVVTMRRSLFADMELPMGEQYSELLKAIINKECKDTK